MAKRHTPTSASKGTDVDGLGGGTPAAHAASHASGGSDPITPSAIGAVAAPTTTVYDFTAATGFTTDNGVGGTAAITAGVARLSNPAGTAQRTGAVGYQGPSIYRALPSPSTVDVAVRIAVMSAVLGTNVTLEISDAASAGTRVCVGARDDREVFFYRNDANTFPAVAAGAFASFTGQEWIRIRAVPGFVTVYYGVGVAGALPTAWTQVGGALALSAYWSHVTMGLVVVATASTSTVDLDDLTVLSVSTPSL